MTIFLSGTRVKYSEYGLQGRLPQAHLGVPPEDQRGIVQRMTKAGNVLVIWDGRKTAQELYPSSLEEAK